MIKYIHLIIILPLILTVSCKKDKIDKDYCVNITEVSEFIIN